MKTLKGIAHDIKGLVKSDKAPLRRPFDPEFDDLHRQYKDLRDWIEQINPSLQQSVEQNHEAARRNAEQAGQFLNLVDDERSGEKPQALAKELRDDVYRWQAYETTGRTPISKAHAIVSKLVALARQTDDDLEKRESIIPELSRALDKVHELHSKAEEKGEEVSVHDKRALRRETSKEQLQTNFDETNRRAKLGMKKVLDLTPRVSYLAVFAYAQWCADTIGFRPMQWAAQPMIEKHGELKDVDNWENVPLQGKSIQEIMNMTEYEETTTPTHMAPAAEEAGATSAVEEREASREHYGAEAGAGKQEMGAEGPTVLGTTTSSTRSAEGPMVLGMTTRTTETKEGPTVLGTTTRTTKIELVEEQPSAETRGHKAGAGTQ